MSDERAKIHRRGFLKAGVAAAAAGAAAGPATTPAAGAAVERTESGIPIRDFGRTGRRLPILGHGGSAIINGEQDYYGLEALPSVDDRIAMVRRAYDLGVRFFDTARIYGESESIMGEALRDVKDDIYLASKVLVREPEQVRPSVEQSLEALGMDAIDCMQVHGPSIERLRYDGAMKLYDELVKLREEGLFKFIGLTGHSAFDEMYKMIATGGFDQLLIEFGYFPKGYNTRHTETNLEWRELCVAEASERGVAIVAMKVLGAWIFGHNAKAMVPDYPEDKRALLPGAAIRYVLNDSRIQVLNMGISLPGDIERNIDIIKGDLTLTAGDRRMLAEFSAQAYLHPRYQDLRLA